MRFADVRKSFGSVAALKGVSLSVRAGQVHAIVGENGAGKSTLMAVAAGEIPLDSGTFELCGTDTSAGHSPDRARELGLALVHQHPALLPDLSVAENLRIAVAPDQRPPWSQVRDWSQTAVTDWRDAPLDPATPARELVSEAQSILEITKAVVQRPKVLILDEPTENLSADEVPKLFATIRDLAARGSGIVYISHRIGEVKEIADQITVLRDGSARGTFDASEVTEDQIVSLIAGRAISSIFPAKQTPGGQAPPLLTIRDLSGPGFSGITFRVGRGEIVGLAGIEGNGQAEILRTLAGLAPARTGSVTVNGRAVRLSSPSRARSAGIAYVPRDRIAEGLMGSLSVRENLLIGTIGRFATAGIINGHAERAHAASAVSRFRIKTASPDTAVGALSGGNQQKVLMSRALDMAPAVVLADEATQGVDVGSRSELYEFLREHAASGAGALVVSSDFRELSGLCDRVIVVSRGQVIAELEGDDVSERQILSHVLNASSLREPAERQSGRRPWARFLRGDFAPPLVLALIIIVLGIVGSQISPFFLTRISMNGILTLFSAMAFVGIAQAIVMMTGGIDLSVGPLMGILVVLGSFVLPDGATAAGIVVGFLIVIAVALAVGAANWVFVSRAKIPPMIATLILYTGLQGISLVLRPLPAGTISEPVANAIGTNIGFFPVAAIVAVVLAVVLDYGLVRTTPGNALRAIGSRSEAARRVGLKVNTITLAAYLGCSLITVLAALMLMGQVQTGDPTVGTNYTLISITAVVLGGASVFGGRGSFIGALLGALLIEEINAVTGIVNLSPAWQMFLQGALTLLAVGTYSSIRMPSEYLRGFTLRRRSPRPVRAPVPALSESGTE
jgi:ribose transport system ATP-binding protein